ncbi:metalloprotease [Anaeromyxobacter oryzisoli]|uniref:metalloprotease n=1 Tax=Anaeromyxobacter oryzisoli TaxID=2925408 RepID=UPI001F57FA3A|nr:site-2 protease family protein [Anaeromyxobacter sp. SG63]
MTPLDPAVFRPALRNVLFLLLAGASGGALLAVLFAVPIAVGGVLGAIAALVALAVRQLGGVRVVASERGLAVLGREDPIDARWGELRLGFGASPCATREPQRYAIVADARGRSFAFADLAGQGACAPVRGLDGREVEVVDLRDAPLLLALLVQRVPAWDILPPALVPPPLEPAPEPGAPADAPRRPARVGAIGVVAKLGGTVAKALKTANVGWAAASAATYAYLFSWQFALALLLQLFVHEYGHVHAMRRTGMRVRGMYFVPFLGAVAVSEDAFTSRRQQAYVALNGPVWGSLLALVPAGLWLWTRQPGWAALCAWWALINLFNLIPVAPLDGGRVMQALAYSFSSILGVALTVAGLGAAVVIGTRLGYGLVWLVAALGAMELAGEVQARAGARALRLLPDRTRFGREHFRWLRAVAGPPLGAPSEPFYLRDLERVEKASHAAPLPARELAAWGVAYAGLAGGLLALVHFMAHVPGADAAARLLG